MLTTVLLLTGGQWETGYAPLICLQKGSYMGCFFLQVVVGMGAFKQDHKLLSKSQVIADVIVR